MKRTLLPLTLLILALTALPAFAGGSAAPYVEAKIGASQTQIDNIRNTSPVASPAPASKSSVDELTGVAGAAVGLNFKGMGLPVRAEVEYAYHSQLSYDASPTFVGAAIPTSIKSDVNSHTLFFNAYYDFETGTAFTPYVGGGLGMAWNHTETTGTVIATRVSQDYNKTTDNFAWNLSAGCGYKLTDNWALNAGYRYLDLGKVAWGDGASSLASKNMTAHEVTLGLRYQF